MRAVDEPTALGGGEHQRKASVGAVCERTFGRLDMARQRRVVVFEHQFRIDLDAAGGGGKARNRAALLRQRIFFVTKRLRETQAFGMLAQVVDSHA